MEKGQVGLNSQTKDSFTDKRLDKNDGNTADSRQETAVSTDSSEDDDNMAYYSLSLREDDDDDDEHDAMIGHQNEMTEITSSERHKRYEQPFRFDDNQMTFKPMSQQTTRIGDDHESEPGEYRLDSGYASRCTTQESLAFLGQDEDGDAGGDAAARKARDSGGGGGNVFVTKAAVNNNNNADEDDDDDDEDEVWLVRRTDLDSWERQPPNDLETIEEEGSIELTDDSFDMETADTTAALAATEPAVGNNMIRGNSGQIQNSTDRSPESGDNAGALKLPYITRLDGMLPGRSLTVTGYVGKNDKSFSVCLQNGDKEPPDVDILLMLHPSISNDKIKFGSYIYGEWMGAQTVPACPFSAGRTYTLRIDILPQFYKIHVNNRAVAEYDHNADASNVTHLKLDGDVTFYGVQCPLEMELPYVEEVDSGLRAGHEIVMDARILSNAKKFELRLGSDTSPKDAAISFVTTVTFVDEKITAVDCDSFVKKKKAGETVTVDGHLPIFKGHEINIRIIVQQKRFLVHLDGDEFAEYDHKLPLEKILYAIVDGDVKLYSLHVIRPRSQSRKTLKKVSGSAQTDCDCCTVL